MGAQKRIELMMEERLVDRLKHEARAWGATPSALAERIFREALPQVERTRQMLGAELKVREALERMRQP